MDREFCCETMNKSLFYAQNNENLKKCEGVSRWENLKWKWWKTMMKWNAIQEMIKQWSEQIEEYWIDGNAVVKYTNCSVHITLSMWHWMGKETEIRDRMRKDVGNIRTCAPNNNKKTIRVWWYDKSEICRETRIGLILAMQVVIVKNISLKVQKEKPKKNRMFLALQAVFP